MKILILIMAIIFMLVVGCAPPTQTENPPPASPQIENPQWVDRLIPKIKAEPDGNPPQSIWRYEYHGQVVYVVPAQFFKFSRIGRLCLSAPSLRDSG